MVIFEMYNIIVSCIIDFYKSCFIWKDMYLCNLYIYIFIYVKYDVMRFLVKRKMKCNRIDNVRLKCYKWIEMFN